MFSKGYVKFRCRWIRTAADRSWPLSEINLWRGRLRAVKILGQDAQGFGFGNISVRHYNSNRFVITGTQTDGLENLD